MKRVRRDEACRDDHRHSKLGHNAATGLRQRLGFILTVRSPVSTSDPPERLSFWAGAWHYSKKCDTSGNASSPPPRGTESDIASTRNLSLILLPRPESAWHPCSLCCAASSHHGARVAPDVAWVELSAVLISRCLEMMAGAQGHRR